MQRVSRATYPGMVLFFVVFVLPSAIAGTRKFDDLSTKNKTFVKETYQKLLQAHERKDFSEMKTDAKDILELLDDYNDTKSYLAIAERGLNSKPRAVVKDPNDDSKLHELAEMEIRGQKLVDKALTSPDSRVELYKLMEELKKLDPNSTYPEEWRKKLHP